jgi:large subunit ribosomal protein L23
MKNKLAVWDVLKSPIITEKSIWLRDATAGEEDGQILTFKVNRNASKTQIKGAVEEVFGVKVDRVRTAHYKGKMKRQGRFVGRKAAWKKAYVTLKAGQPHVDYAEAI